MLATGCKNEKKQESIEGKWTGAIENQVIYQKNSNTVIGGQNDYLLECNEKKCILYLDDNNKVEMKYVLDNNEITFIDENQLIIGKCKKSLYEINCDEVIPYASKFIKK